MIRVLVNPVSRSFRAERGPEDSPEVVEARLVWAEERRFWIEEERDYEIRFGLRAGRVFSLPRVMAALESEEQSLVWLAGRGARVGRLIRTKAPSDMTDGFLVVTYEVED